MRSISIDLETYSSVDLAKSGVYHYAESSDFEVLLFGYSFDNSEAIVIDLINGETIPSEIIKALTDNSIIKWAFNSQFERICLSRFLSFPKGKYLDPTSWRCTMVWSAYMGLPLNLLGVGAVLGLEKQKLTEGKDLVRYFCKPCKPSASNNERIRNLPSDALDKWKAFKAYNQRDVETEMSIQDKLSKFPVPDNIWDEYHLDQEINDRGVAIDMTLVSHAIEADKISRTDITKKITALTNIENPNSISQMKTWLAEQGLETDSLDKKAVAELLKTVPEPFTNVLELRQSLAKSSIKKYTAMENAVCSDGRIRGMFFFYGANRTGRFSSKYVQLQNLPQNHLLDLEQARALVRSGNFTALEMLYDSVPEVLSQLIRTAFIPSEGYKLIVSDFSSIERVVLAWLAGEKWVLDAYSTKKDLYTATASQMFNVPIEEINKKGPLRQKGKVADLACGYGGSTGALIAMGSLEMGLTEEELKPLVTTWRAANPNIVRFWWDVDRAALKTVKDRTTTETHGIRFSYQSGMLFIILPSGRRLSYVKPRIGTNQFGSECVTYEGVGATKKWERIQSYGPKFVENIVQAISRDLLCHAMQNLRHFPIVMHIHDEIVIEAENYITVESICAQMCQLPSWAKGLLLRAGGYETNFYKKD